MESKAERALAEALAGAVLRADPGDNERMLTRLAALSGREWLRLDQSARPLARESPLAWVTGWPSRLAADDGGIAAVAGSLGRDGRVREAAVAILARTPGPVAAAALAVRTADWVPQVRDAAADALGMRSSTPDIAVIVAVVLALRERRRGRLAAEAYLAGLATGPAAMLESLSEAGERGGRLWALSARAERELLAAGELEARAMRDRDPVVALWCARQLAALPAWRRAGSGPRLLGSARASVRAFAVRQLADDLLPRDLLAAPLPRQVAAALQGLDDVGDGCLPDAAMPFLTYPSPRVRHAAVYAVGRHSGPGDLPARLAPALRDESDKVVAAALRFLRGYRLPAAVLDDLDAAGTPRSRRTALAIRQRLSPWDRIHADLTAISGPDPELADTGRADLLAWLRHGAATTYGRPSPGRAAQIAALLATSSLGAGARREVAFVAGIR